MMAQSDKKIQRPRRRATRFPGIVADAARLGVSRIHLYYVLTGQRESRPLLARYRDLKAKGGAA